MKTTALHIGSKSKMNENWIRNNTEIFLEISCKFNCIYENQEQGRALYSKHTL